MKSKFKKIIFLYPSEALNSKKIDSFFAEESQALQQQGFSISLVALEDMKIDLRKLSTSLSKGSVVVYRGWMLSSAEYSNLLNVLAEHELTPLTPVGTYLLAHHLPQWYSLLSDLTPETVVFNEFENELSLRLSKLGWDEYFIKDYVKSLKTSIGSIIKSSDDISAVIREMKKFRGKIEGGICVRRVENYLEDSEERYFVIDNIPHAATKKKHIPEIVHECSKRIRSPFFSVDIAKRDDGQLRVVEIGDGQVSDLVGWSTERFAEIWKMNPSL